MEARREFPVNPNVVLYHLPERLTDEVVEAYAPGDAERVAANGPSPRPWIEAALAVTGVRSLSLNAYLVRLIKRKRADWDPILSRVEPSLCGGLGVDRIAALEELESRRRHFTWRGTPFSPKAVFEGLKQAGSSQVASALFAIPGVAEVVLAADRVEVRKCPLYSWLDLQPRIETCLEKLAVAQAS